MKNNTDLSVVAEVENSDADLSVGTSKTNDEDDTMNISEKEEQETVGYKETLKINV